MNSQEDSQIDSVIEYLCEYHFDAENAFKEPVYRDVIQGYLQDSNNIKEVAGKTDGLRHLLHTYRRTLYREIVGYPRLDWEDRKKQAVEYLDKASELLDDPFSNTDFYEISKFLNEPERCQLFKDKGITAPGRILNKDDVEKLGELDILGIVIWRIAQALEKTPTEKIIPYYARNPLYIRQGYLPDDASARGSKSNKTIFYRRLDRALSENTRNKAAVISKLTEMAIKIHRKQYHSLYVPDLEIPEDIQLKNLFESDEMADLFRQYSDETNEEEMDKLDEEIDKLIALRIKMTTTTIDEYRDYKTSHRDVANALKAKTKNPNKAEKRIKAALNKFLLENPSNK